MAATSEISASLDQDAFFAWLPDDLGFRVAVRREHGKWYALASDFDITGMGDSLKDALVDMEGLVYAYLGSYFREGRPFKEALRPIPLRLHLEILVGTAITKLLHLGGGRGRLPRESRYLFAPH